MPVFRIETFEERPGTLGQVISQAEDLDLFGALVARPQISEVVQFPPFRSMPVEHGVAQHRKPRFSQEDRDCCHEKKYQQPWVEEDHCGKQR